MLLETLHFSVSSWSRIVAVSLAIPLCSMLSLTGPSAVSRLSKPKKQQGDVMLQQWMLSKTTAIPQPRQQRTATTASSSDSSTQSIPQTAPTTQEEAKQQLEQAAVDDDALLLSLSRDVNYLNDEMSSSDRKQALTRIAHCLHVPHSASSSLDVLNTVQLSISPLPSTTLATATSLLTKPLLRRLTDAAEQCRLLACAVLSHLVAHCLLSTLIASLPYILPAVAFRLNCRDLTSAAQPYSAANTHTHYPPSAAASNAEPSEEVRLQLLQLTAAIVQRFSSEQQQQQQEASFKLFLADIVTIVAQSVTDRSPPLKQAATSLLIALLSSHSHQLRSTSLLLARLLTPNLLHKHSRVRVLSVQAMQRLLAMGAAEHIRVLAAFQEHNVIDLHAFYHGSARCHYLAALCQDGNERVREALYGLVGGCMTEMVEAADYETLLMPYLLSGLADVSPSSRSLCRSYLDKLAAQYRQEHLDEIEEVERYTQPSGVCGAGVQQLSSFPYSGRPSLALQLRLRVFVDRLFPALLAELSDWKAEVRGESVRLMRTLLWLEEHSVGAEWRTELLRVAIRRSELEERLRRDERGGEEADHELEAEAVWGEAMQLLARFGGDELLRELRRQRDDGHELGVMALLPALLAGMDDKQLAEVADEVEGWLDADRRAAVLGRAQLRRQVRVYGVLVTALASASLLQVVAAGLEQLAHVVASESRELSGGAERVAAMLRAVHERLATIAQ